jgi:hypothetical protein
MFVRGVGVSTLSDARARMDQADLTLCALVEIQRGAQLPATPGELVALIGGSADTRGVAQRMVALQRMGVISRVLDASGALALTSDGQYVGYQLTAMGEQLLSEDLANWQPEPSERARREKEILEAVGGVA